MLVSKLTVPKKAKEQNRATTTKIWINGGTQRLPLTFLSTSTKLFCIRDTIFINGHSTELFFIGENKEVLLVSNMFFCPYVCQTCSWTLCFPAFSTASLHSSCFILQETISLKTSSCHVRLWMNVPEIWAFFWDCRVRLARNLTLAKKFFQRQMTKIKCY